MRKDNRERLKKRGWRLGTVEDFLGLSPAEAAYVELRLRLSETPHFHATYGDHEIAVAIRDGEVLWGTFPKRALAHVMEWREAHVAELEQDWERARAKQPLLPVEPLE